MALIVGFEGLPGCGKTTVIELLMYTLCAAGLRATAIDINTATCDPFLHNITTTYALNSLIRSMVLWVRRIEQYAMIQRIEDMDVIFFDRTWGTALAFDYYGNGISREFLNHIGQNLKPPDITFLFEAPLDVVGARKESRTMRDPEFAHRVEQGYQELADAFSWIRVDATRTPEEVKKCCLAMIYAVLAGFIRQ